jgi:hypothetical protein
MEYPPFPNLPGIEFRIIQRGIGYAASSDGSIWTCRGRCGKFTDRWIIRAVRPDKVGRLRYCLFIDGKKVYVRGNILVAETFLGPIPDGMVVAHYPDKNPANNAVSNLVITTQLENVQHAIEHGTQVVGERVHNSFLTAEVVKELRDFVKQNNYPIRTLAREIGINYMTLRQVIIGRTWKHVT